MRWARYSALPWMSLAIPSAGTCHPPPATSARSVLERLLEGGDPEHAVGACADDSNVNLGGARLSPSMPASSLARPPQCFVRAGKLVVERNKLGVESAGKPKIAGVVQ
jgi:hypothetical protein